VRSPRTLLLLAALPAVLAACGGGSGTTTTTTPPPATTAAAPAPAATTTTTGTSPGALQADATSAATGDIPDNQVFLAFHDPAAGYSLKYPEGWAQSGGGNVVTFRDKNNIIRVSLRSGPAPTAASVAHDLGALPHVVRVQSPVTLTLAGGAAFKATYETRSAPNAVTGKRVTLTVDRYVIAHRGKVAVIDLATPIGVDNVDAYRLIAHSFTWS